MVAAQALYRYAPFVAGGTQRMYRGGLNHNVKTQGYNPSMVITNRRRKKSGRYSLRSAILSQKPAKHFNDDAQAAGMTQDTLNCVNITGGVIQGDADNQRDGDTITLCGLNVNGFYNTSSAAGAYSFRVLVGYSGEEYTYGLNFTAGGALTATEMFLPQTTTAWIQNGIVNPKAFTVLYDKKYECNSQIAGIADIANFSFRVPLNDTKFLYQSNASQFGKTRNLYMVVIGAVVTGVAGITNVGTVFCSYDLIFK